MKPNATPVDVAYAALVDAGRPDLATSIVWVDDDGVGYLEAFDELSPSDNALVDRAEQLAHAALAHGLVRNGDAT